jgi:hypothetical protein
VTPNAPHRLRPAPLPDYSDAAAAPLPDLDAAPAACPMRTTHLHRLDSLRLRPAPHGPPNAIRCCRSRAASFLGPGPQEYGQALRAGPADPTQPEPASSAGLSDTPPTIKSRAATCRHRVAVPRQRDACGIARQNSSTQHPRAGTRPPSPSVPPVPPRAAPESE